jgi:hypothetical protein
LGTPIGRPLVRRPKSQLTHAPGHRGSFFSKTPVMALATSRPLRGTLPKTPSDDGSGPGDELRHDPADPLLMAVARGAPPREILGHIRHEMAREIAALEFYQLNRDAYPPHVVTELSRLAGRRQRVLVGLARMAFRDLDKEREQAEVPAEVLEKLKALFVEKVLEAARGVCSTEDTRNFEVGLREKMNR